MQRMRNLRAVAVVVAVAVLSGGVRAADGPVNLRRTYVVKVVQANRESVVNVNTTQIVRQWVDDDPFARLFFNAKPHERELKRTSLGSGFIVHADGYVVTNAHVIDGADEVEVILADGTHVPATVLASDSAADLAVLKIKVPAGKKLKPVVLGDSSDLMMGEPVVAIGNPLGFEHSVTTGIVSATNRTLNMTDAWTMKGLIQTDTAINPGNSGGPLLNAYGQVIGITSAIRSDAQNIGFAIPVNRLRALIPALMSPLAVNHVDLGGGVVEKTTITPPAKVTSELWWQSAGKGAVAQRLEGINGVTVRNVVDAAVELLKAKQGGTLVLDEEGGRTEKLAVRAAPLSDAQRLAKLVMGVEVRELSARDSQQLGGRVGGVEVEAVDPDGPAAKAGLRSGDVIAQVGRYRIRSMSGLSVLLGEVHEAMPADVYVIRRGQIGRARLILRPRQAL